MTQFRTNEAFHSNWQKKSIFRKTLPTIHRWNMLISCVWPKNFGRFRRADQSGAAFKKTTGCWNLKIAQHVAASLTHSDCGDRASANESKCGHSTGLILMPFGMNVRTYVVYFVCKFRAVWLGGRYSKLVRKIAVKSVNLTNFRLWNPWKINQVKVVLQRLLCIAPCTEL